MHNVHQRFLIITDKSCSVTSFLKIFCPGSCSGISPCHRLGVTDIFLRTQARNFKLVNTHMSVTLHINCSSIRYGQDWRLRQRVICNDFGDMRMHPQQIIAGCVHADHAHELLARL